MIRVRESLQKFYTENDFWRIRNTILEKEKTIFDHGLNYEEVETLYETYGEKFSLEMFAEHVLGIHGNRLTKSRYNPNQRTEVTDISLEQITYIQETRKVIALGPETDNEQQGRFKGNVFDFTGGMKVGLA